MGAAGSRDDPQQQGSAPGRLSAGSRGRGGGPGSNGGGPPGLRVVRAPGASPGFRPTHVCHACNLGIRLAEGQSTCPQCGGGFIEEMRQSDAHARLLQLLAALNAEEEAQEASSQGPQRPRGSSRTIRGNRAPAEDPNAEPASPAEDNAQQRLQELFEILQLTGGLRRGLGFPPPETHEQMVERTAYRGGGADSIHTPSSDSGNRPLPPALWAKIETVCAPCEERDAGCAICCTEFAAGAAETATDKEGAAVCRLPHCRHEFHRGCLEAWFSRASFCPMCRTDLATGEAEWGGEAK